MPTARGVGAAVDVLNDCLSIGTVVRLDDDTPVAGGWTADKLSRGLKECGEVGSFGCNTGRDQG